MIPTISTMSMTFTSSTTLMTPTISTSPTPTTPNSKKSHGKVLFLNNYYFNYVK